MAKAHHAETGPTDAEGFISRLACSLVGITQEITIEKGSLSFELYQKPTSLEVFQCNYGLNPRFMDQLGDTLRISGKDMHNEPRIIELPDHRFFMATLFLPQQTSRPGKPHPLIAGFIRVAAG
ncbi:MAG: hypothetical protein HKM93_19510 [Desulfobacteraceae bacterium]|nr:hypothetical protein [Desulfobacteraceae bacterium]